MSNPRSIQITDRLSDLTEQEIERSCEDIIKFIQKIQKPDVLLKPLKCKEILDNLGKPLQYCELLYLEGFTSMPYFTLTIETRGENKLIGTLDLEDLIYEDGEESVIELIDRFRSVEKGELNIYC